MTGSSSKLLQIQGKWYQERKPKQIQNRKKIPKTILHPSICHSIGHMFWHWIRPFIWHIIDIYPAICSHNLSDSDILFGIISGCMTYILLYFQQLFDTLSDILCNVIWHSITYIIFRHVV